MEQKQGVAMTKPLSLWAKPVKIKLRLFKDLYNFFKDMLTGDVLKIPADIADIFSGLDIKTGTGERGWLLVTRALMEAMKQLVEEHKHLIDIDAAVPGTLDDRFNEILEKGEYYIGFDFFENPKNLGILVVIQPIYRDFLTGVGFDAPAAESMGNRLPSYFVLALMDEWRKHPAEYQSLETAIKTPFDKAGQEEREWLHYLAWLKKQVEEPVFAETFSLVRVYIPLRGYYKEKVKSKANDDAEGYKETIGEAKYNKIAVDLETELLAWVNTEDKDDSLRIIAGGPGYGKSSFLKMFAARLADTYTRVLYIPLHRFEIKDDLLEALQTVIRYNGYLTRDPLAPGEEKLLIIFDGLDELAMQGRALAEAAAHFIHEIKMKLLNLNSHKTRLQVVMSGRDIIIQANEAEFRKEKQLLHILPYYIDKEKRKEYTAETGFLEKDQRDEWWKNYGAIKGKDYTGLPKELKNRDLDELTVQPLLNYLVAITYERGRLQFTESTQLNEIYADLLKAVHDRSYEENRVLRAVEQLDYEHFVRILEEIAVCAWHGDGRTTTAAEIERHCSGSGLDKILETFKVSAQQGIVSIMTAFYFRKAGRQSTGDETFEFTHKSFGEYLAARRIVGKIRQVNKKRLERESSPDEGWGIKECLTEWIKIFGPKELDRDILKFIINEMAALYRDNKEEVRALQATIIQMMNFMLKTGMPMETAANAQGARNPYYVENRRAIASEKALLIMLSTISDCTGEISHIAWPSDTSFGELISRLQGQRTGDDNFILKFLTRLDLRNAILLFKDFYGANFRETNLSNASLQMVIFQRVDLKGADLRGADLREANLKEADLTGVDFSGANLWKADFKEANISGASLKKAHLRLADFREADLTGADFSGANLWKTDFKEANISGASLKKAHLREADFREAYLTGADFSGANLWEAKVTEDQLKEAIIDKETKLPWEEEIDKKQETSAHG